MTRGVVPRWIPVPAEGSRTQDKHRSSVVLLPWLQKQPVATCTICDFMNYLAQA